MDCSFRFRQFSLRNRDSALKLGTDAVLLGAAMTISPRDRRALDIGTGTGVIALMAAQRATGLHIDGIDIDGPSASEARFNFEESPWSERLHSHHCALKDFRPDSRYDLIFSNPPFYDGSLRNPDTRKAAARHDDSLTPADIFSFAAGQLEENGRLSLIIPYDRFRSVSRVAAAHGLHPFRLLTVHTVSGKPPKRIMAEFMAGRQPVIDESAMVLMEDGRRSKEYGRLTEEFYL